MISVHAAAACDLLTKNGDVDGFGIVTVSSNAAYFPGATVYLSDSTGLSQKCHITKLVSTTGIGIRFSRSAGEGYSYGLDGCSAFTTANSAKISQDAQEVPIDITYNKRPIY